MLSVQCTYTLHMLRDCPIFWISLEITNSVVYKWFSIGPVTDGSYCVWYHLGLKTFQDPTKIFKVWLLFVDLRVDILGSVFLNILINTSAIMTYAYIQITKYLSVFVFFGEKPGGYIEYIYHFYPFKISIFYILQTNINPSPPPFILYLSPHMKKKKILKTP